MKNVLEAILASGTVPQDLVITYDDVHGLWGGAVISIRGSGRGERCERAVGGAKPKVFEKAISQEQLLELVDLLIELEAWEQQTPDRQWIPDESRATLNISIGGQTSSMWERCNEMAENKRLTQIKTKMSEMTGSNQRDGVE